MSIKAIFPAVLIAFGAYLYFNYGGLSDDDGKTQENIVSAWKNIIREPSQKFRRVAIGINANVDLIVPAIDLLKSLNITPGGKADHSNLDSLEKLQETFALFFARGSAAERYFGNEALYRKIVEAARGLENKQLFIGGNAALMANKITSLFPDTEIQFVGPVGPALEELFPDSIKIPPESRVTQDEVHLIMEYKVGDQWGKDVTPVATRFITSFDQSNSEVTMMGTFFHSIANYKPDLILLSGLHMMEGLDMPMFTQRLHYLVEGLDQVSSLVPIHMELASMAKGDYLEKILQEVLPRITSLGLNEQEISFSAAIGNGPHPELFTELSGQPDIYKIGDMVLWLLQTFGYSDKRPKSRLTRVHFHSLTYHIIGVVPSLWGNSEAAVAAGARLAGRQACDVDTLSSAGVDLKIPQKFKLFSRDQERSFDSKNPVVTWDLEGFHFTFSPVLVCKSPGKTVGLGDAISSTGLLFSEYKTSQTHTKV